MDLVELYRRFLLELWSAPDEDLERLAAEVVSPDFVGYWPDHVVHGPSGLAEVIKAGREPFDDVNVRLESGPITGEDMVAARWTFSGKLPDGTPYVLRGADVLRVEDGRFAEYWPSSDGVTANAALSSA